MEHWNPGKSEILYSNEHNLADVSQDEYIYKKIEGCKNKDIWYNDPL